MKRRFQVKLRKKVRARSGDKRLLALGAAMSSALVASDTSEAVPIYVDPKDQSISPGDGPINLNLSNLINPTFNEADAALQYNRDPTGNNLNLEFNSLGNMAAAIENPLNLNAEIGEKNEFTTNFNLLNGAPLDTVAAQPWLGATNAFLGMQVDVPGGSLHYGWVRLSVDANNVVVHDMAIESDAGAPIRAGAGAAIPEPGSLGLLALGAAGLVAWRRRRSET